MSRLLLSLSLLLGTAASLRADEKKPEGMPGVVQRLWNATETVLDHHVKPPTRQEMFLSAAQNLLKQTSQPPAQDLPRRVSKLTTREQFTTLIEGLLPTNLPDIFIPPEVWEPILMGGLLQSVPGFPSWISGPQLKVTEQIQGNRYVGIGVQISWNNAEKYVQILSPFRKGAAYKAGAKVDDLILDVDGKDTLNVPLPKVIDWLRGEDGSPVTVTVRQPGAKETRVLKMTRAVVPFDNLVGFRRIDRDTWDYRLTDKNIAYVAVKMISGSTLSELRQLERRFQADGIEAIIFDMRFALSGTAHQSALVADALLDGGLMWKVRDATGRVKEYKADRDCLFRDLPLAILVNGAEGPAVDLIAGALQDNKRAVIVGRRTRGDGYLRSQVKLPEGEGALELRTAVVERAVPRKSEEKSEREALPGWGVEPDQRVELNAKQREAIGLWLMAKDAPEPKEGEQAPDDPQLTKAVEVLRTALKK